MAAGLAHSINQIVQGSMSEELHATPVVPITQQLNHETHKQVIADALSKAVKHGENSINTLKTGIHNAAKEVKKVVNEHKEVHSEMVAKVEKKTDEIAQAVLNGIQAITHESVQMSDRIKAAQEHGDSDKVISEAMAGLFAIGKDAADMVAQLKKAQERATHEKLIQMPAVQAAPEPEIRQLEDLAGKKLIQLSDGSLAILEDDWFTPQLQTMYEPVEEIAELSSEYFQPQYFYGY